MGGKYKNFKQGIKPVAPECYMLEILCLEWDMWDIQIHIFQTKLSIKCYSNEQEF